MPLRASSGIRTQTVQCLKLLPPTGWAKDAQVGRELTRPTGYYWLRLLHDGALGEAADAAESSRGPKPLT